VYVHNAGAAYVTDATAGAASDGQEWTSARRTPGDEDGDDD
jgi:hypothetical protein